VEPVRVLVGDAMKAAFWLRARDAVTGRFVRLVDALKRKATTVVERVRKT
jgi:hypothetical protein